MIDWKYGFYRLLWWTGLISSISFVDYLVKASWGVSTVLVLAVVFVFINEEKTYFKYLFNIYTYYTNCLFIFFNYLCTSI